MKSGNFLHKRGFVKTQSLRTVRLEALFGISRRGVRMLGIPLRGVKMPNTKILVFSLNYRWAN